MIEDILSSLEKVKRSGPNNWLACCPAHNDRSPSLTLHAADDGRILVNCHGGCSFEQIVTAVGLGWDVWFPPKPIELARAIRRPFPAADILEALATEALIVSVAAGNIASGLELSEEDQERLWMAYHRISEGREIALGKR